jgi:phenylalanyl-tRNA synthetase beta chain
LEHAVKILNPLSNDLDVMRQSLLYSGLEAIAYNQNRRNADLKLYEFGKVYSVKDEKYNETQRFSIFITGKKSSEYWANVPNYLMPIIGAQSKLIKELGSEYPFTSDSKEKVSKVTADSINALSFGVAQEQAGKYASFYDLKAIVDGLLIKLNIKDAIIEDATCSKMAFGLQYMRNGKQLVKFGSVAAASLKLADVGQEVFYADFNFDLVLAAVRKNKIIYQEVSKFPAVRRDLSMLVDTQVTFGQLKQIAQKTERKLLQDVNVFDVYQGDKLPAGKKSYALSFTLQDEEKTLTDKGIDSIMQKLIYNFGKEAGAEIRK